MNNPKIAFLFPGQGSQYPGIGCDLHRQYDIVKKTYSEASDVLGYDIARLSFTDPDNQINLTRYTQPVLLTHSIACLRLFQQQTHMRVIADIAAGHSLGEYSALVAAGVLSFAQALKLVKTRGELMGEYGEGEMQALMLDAQSATSLAQQHYCSIAAYNLPEQNVVGGSSDDLDALTRTMASAYPRKRHARLKTEGAFHTYYMIEAAKRFRSVLEQTEFNPAPITPAQIAPKTIAVMSNFTGDKHQADATAIKSRLFLQLFNPVLWYQNLLNARQDGATIWIEFGGGLGAGATPADQRPTLQSMIKKAFRDEQPAPQYHCVINANTLNETVLSFDD